MSYFNMNNYSSYVNNQSGYYIDSSSETYSSGIESNESTNNNMNNQTDQSTYYGSYTNSYCDSYNQGYYYTNEHTNYNYYNNNYFNQQPNTSNEVVLNQNEKVSEMEAIDSIDVKLTNESLWNKFHAHTTEMILTKQGRKMFPILQYSVEGMLPDKKYYIFVEMVKTVPNSWKYQSGKWIQCQAQLQDEASNNNNLIHMHPDSPNTGAYWMKNEILFAKLKVTNNKQVANENILLLNSMHKYMPKLHIVSADSLNVLVKKPKLKNFDSNGIRSVCFDQTQFIAVTAYLNRAITELKIEYNPFAKGFRDIEQNNYSISLVKTSPSVSPNSSKIINNTSTPKLAYNSNSFYFNQENLSPTSSSLSSNHNFNNYSNANLSPYSNDYYKNSCYYYNYSNFYNNSHSFQTNYSNTSYSNSVDSDKLTTSRISNKRKYDETVSQEDYLDFYSNNYNLPTKHHCSNSYNVLRSTDNVY